MNINQYNSLNFLNGELVNFFPAHEKFINARFDKESHENLQIADSLSENILKIADKEFDSYLSGYKWICEAVLKEEIYFRRNNFKYRLSKFQDAVDEVYSNPDIMEPYMKGLLLSQVLWKNHTLVHQFFVDFLNNYKQSGNYIEIGAGHGLFLAKACQVLLDGFDIQAWDISDSSLKETQNCLDKLDIERDIQLRKQDFNTVAKDAEKADLLVFSEILEHLENPVQVLKTLKTLMKEDGFLFLNAPVNSPAPDHITNWNDPDELISQVCDAGFDIKVKQVIPSTGLSIDKALKHKGAISVIVIARNA